MSMYTKEYGPVIYHKTLAIKVPKTYNVKCIEDRYIFPRVTQLGAERMCRGQLEWYYLSDAVLPKLLYRYKEVGKLKDGLTRYEHEKDKYDVLVLDKDGTILFRVANNILAIKKGVQYKLEGNTVILGDLKIKI